VIRNPGWRDGGDAQAAETIRIYQRRIAAQLDRMMALLLAAEWIGAVCLALLIAPLTWSGASASVHPHLIAALLLGPA